MAAIRAIIRYSFIATADDSSQKTTAIITAVIQGATAVSARNYLIKKYPDRHNIEIIELSFQKS